VRKGSEPRLRALVLAAGLGTRLQPLTDEVPKALLPVAGVPLIQLTLTRLAALGCEAVAINLHHLGGAVRQALGDDFRGLPLTYSEEPRLLGTLGALAPLREFLGAAEVVVVVNGDSLCRWPLRRLVRRHLASGARASLLLARRAPPEAFGGGVGVDGDGRVVSFRAGGLAIAPAARRLVFAGAQALSPDLLAAVGERPADLVTDLYEPLLAAGSPLLGVETGRRWHDLGIPRRYLEGLLDWIRGPWPWRRSWISPRAGVAAGARVRRSLVEAEARVEVGARLDEAVVLPGARVGRGAELRRSILGFGTALPAGARVENRVIATHRPGRAVGPRDTVVGQLLYRPLGPPSAGGQPPPR
jgi:mannose-1-phosphate guanylyltransferase